MKRLFSLFVVACLAFFACDNNRTEALQKKEDELNRKEQELLSKEKALEIRESELMKREQEMDSLTHDSTMAPPFIAGNWTTKMTCTETTCTGSAVGDVKTEHWSINLDGPGIIAKAVAGEQLVRVYSGSYTGNTIELVEDRQSTSNQPATKMVVRLRIVDSTTMEGQREIVRDNNCKIIYAVQMNKQ